MKQENYIVTKPKIFYDLMTLFDKINIANKNILRYDRLTIIEPYILDNIASAMRKISTKAKENKKSIKNPEILPEAIEDVEMAREFFMFFSQNRKLNYNQSFILEINLNFESIIKQIYGWHKHIERAITPL